MKVGETLLGRMISLGPCSTAQLSTHVRAFLDAVFEVEDIREPTPTDTQAARYPFVSDNLRVPEFIIYILRKP